MVGDKIKECREKRNMTQEDLGLLVGRSKQVICRMEKSRGGISLDMIEKLSDALKVNPNIFLPKRYVK